MHSIQTERGHVMSVEQHTPNITPDELHSEIRKEYAHVALDPHKGYHFHTGRAALTRLGYVETLYAGLLEDTIASFSGTGNPFIVGPIMPGDTVVDAGSGAGLDSMIASRLVGLSGRVNCGRSAGCRPATLGSSPRFFGGRDRSQVSRPFRGCVRPVQRAGIRYAGCLFPCPQIADRMFR